MKSTLKFIKTTAIGGLLVILPLVVILFVVGQVLFAIYSTSYAIVEFEHMPAFIKNNPLLVVAGAFGMIVGACFVTGLLVQTSLGQYLKRNFKEKVIDRIPVIRAVTKITERFAGVDGDEFVPVEVSAFGDGIAVIGLLVEHLPDGRCAVFVPTSPVTTVGNVLIVPPDRLRHLDAGISDAISAISQWGVDTVRIYSRTDDAIEPN